MIRETTAKKLAQLREQKDLDQEEVITNLQAEGYVWYEITHIMHNIFGHTYGEALELLADVGILERDDT